jgi:hypothetical protein
MQIWFVLSVFGGDCYMNVFANYQGLMKRQWRVSNGGQENLI